MHRSLALLALVVTLAPGCAGKLGGDLAVGPGSKPTPPPASRELAGVTGATLKLEISGLTSADLTRFGLALTPDGRFAPVVVPLAAPASNVPSAPSAPALPVTMPFDPEAGVWTDSTKKEGN